MSGSSSPPEDAMRVSAARPGSPSSRSAAESATPAAQTRLWSSPLVSSTHSSAVASAIPRSPAASAVKERLPRLPGERLDVARQSCSLDGVVEQLAGFGQLAAQQLDLAENRVRKRDELALARRPADSYRSFGVGFRILVAVEIELGAGQVGGGIEPKCELVIVQIRDEGGRLRATCFGLRRGSARRAREGAARRPRPRSAAGRRAAVRC